jgi:hypothetical protein
VRWSLRHAAVFAGVLAACSASKVIEPSVPDYASGSLAEDSFQALRAKWEHGDREARLALEPALAHHAETHAKDPTARVANAMRALVSAARGDAAKASGLATPIVLGPPGVTRDMALVAEASALRHEGKPKEALAILKPLFGRMLDPFGRDMLNEEATMAAVDVEDFGDAIRFMRGWVRETEGADRDEMERRIAALLAKIPADPLLQLVRDVKGTDEIDSPLLRRVGERLTSLVLATKDVDLAKILMTEARPILGDKTDEVARVAARGAAIRLESNTVGVLLSLRSEELQRRGLEVSNGLALALGIPGSAARVVSRDDQGSEAMVDDALALLNADGAAVIIAGADTKEADKARAYAERTNVPVLLLRPPSKPVRPDGPVFVVGDDPVAVRGALVRSLGAAGFERLAIVVGDRDDGDVPTASDGATIVGVTPCGSTMDFLAVQKATGLVLDGSPRCTTEAADHIPAGVAVALGLDAPFAIKARARARAGFYPVPPIPSAADSDIARFLELGRGAPSWWAGLGHDAGKLAWAAVKDLPSEVPADTEAMSARKALVTSRVASADVQLWTTDARGFRGGRVVARDVVIAAERGAAPAAGDKHR